VTDGDIGGAVLPIVNARDLHTFLENRDLFANWIKARVEKYGFEENRDFRIDLVKTKTIRTYRGGERIGTSTRTDYHLTLDMAKELSMVENNAKGREARRYFIDMERQALAAAGQQPQTIAGQTIGMDGFHVLGALVAGKLRALPSPARSRARARLWSQVHTAFNVRSAQDIPADQLDAARNFVAAYALEGEWLGRDEAANRREAGDWSNIGAMIHCIEQTYAVLETHKLYTHLTALGCDAGVLMLGLLWDGLGSAGHVRKHCAAQLALGVRAPA